MKDLEIEGLNLSRKEKRLFNKIIKKKEEKRGSVIKTFVLAFGLLLLVVRVGYLWTLTPVEPKGSSKGSLSGTATLKVGSSAPNFSLTATTGKQVSLKDYKGKNVLLYFQEGLMCQPCWKQIAYLEKDLAQFDALNTDIVTVGVESAQEWEPILKEEGVKEIPVLVDAQREMSSTYGVLDMPSQMHSDRPGHTFVLINKEGKVVWIADYPTMRVSNEEILTAVKEALTQNT